MDFSTDGKLLAAGGFSRIVQLFNVPEGQLQRTLSECDELIWSVAFSRRDDVLVAGTGRPYSSRQMGRVTTWSVQTGELLRTTPEVLPTVRSVACSPTDDQTLALGLEDGNVVLLDMNTLKVKRTVGSHADSVCSVAISPDGQTLASGSRDNLVKLWDLRTGDHANLEGHQGYVFSVAFSPDGKCLASGSRDGTIRFWDPQVGRERATLDEHSTWVMSVGFSPDGGTLISADLKGKVKLWDVPRRECRLTLSGHDRLLSAAFSGDVLAASGVSGTVRTWRAGTESQVRQSDSARLR